MRKSKFTETQIVGILKDAESGVPVSHLLGSMLSKATLFKWRSKYGGASVSDVKRLRELEAENTKLKRMFADLAIAELRALTDTWLRIYNGERPHESLGRVPPVTFLPKPSSAEKSAIELSA